MTRILGRRLNFTAGEPFHTIAYLDLGPGGREGVEGSADRERRRIPRGSR
jgi:hypothetical protein